MPSIIHMRIETKTKTPRAEMTPPFPPTKKKPQGPEISCKKLENCTGSCGKFETISSILMIVILGCSWARVVSCTERGAFDTKPLSRGGGNPTDERQSPYGRTQSASISGLLIARNRDAHDHYTTINTVTRTHEAASLYVTYWSRVKRSHFTICSPWSFVV